MTLPFVSLPRGVAAALCAAAALTAATRADAAGALYRRSDLVSDGSVAAAHVDPSLVNAWGVAFNPFGPVWVADNGRGVSTLYDGQGNPVPLVVQIPSVGNASGGGNPTGIVFNGSAGFVVHAGGLSGPSRFLFASEDGGISGWAPNLGSPIATFAVRVVDNSRTSGAVYKGLALSAGGSGSLLYAADFHNARIDVFDAEFKPVTLGAGAFTDAALPAGFAPFGLQAINGDLYVSYARQDADRHDDVQGKGLGFVDVFAPDGRLIRRVATRGRLNAPWGMALAPAGFGTFAGRLLVGNFGDGRINAYDVHSGEFVGQLKGPDRRPIAIEGLWGLAFGNGFAGQPVDTLFFAAGPGDEQHGLYGRIDVLPGDDRDDAPDAED